MGAELNPAQRLHAAGQSLWLDSINRVMLRTGALARYVGELAVTGLTSNPTILGHAMAAGSDYDTTRSRSRSSPRRHSIPGVGRRIPVAQEDDLPAAVPRNAERLRESIAQLRAGSAEPHELAE